jgi:hypothetical protein
MPFMRQILTAAFLMISVAAFSQNFSAGIKAGANITNFTGGDFSNVDKKALVGFHAGGWLNFGLGPVSIQPELLVSTGGAKFEVAGQTENYKLTYVTVPVMVKFKSAGGFYLEAGPQVGFKISEDVGNSTINDFAKDLDLSAGAGLGFQFGPIGIGGRYLVGLSKVGDFNASQGIDPDFKNSTIQLGVSLRLGN